MNVKPTLNEFLELKGYKCCICDEAYSAVKKPSLLSCNQHNLCLDCIRQSGPQLRTCPVCRDEIRFNASPKVNSQLVSAVDVTIELYEALYGEKTSVVEAPKVVVPGNFACLSLCEQLWDQRDFYEEIQTVLPNIIETMRWQNESKELQTELDNRHGWRALVDDETKQIHAIAKVIRMNGEVQIHWAGATEINMSLYVELFKHILFEIQNGNTSSYSNPVKVNFNYDKESEWLGAVLLLLISHNIHFELKDEKKHWGLQSQLTIHPNPRLGQRFVKIDRMPTKTLEEEKTSKSFKTGLIERFRIDYLSVLFRQCYGEGAGSYSNDFKNSANQYFVYTVNGTPAGFVRFIGADYNRLKVLNCFVNNDHLKYSDHFIEQFIHWAKTSSSCGKSTPATDVVFHPNCTQNRFLIASISKFEER